MSESYEPPERDIDAALQKAGFDPRMMAIAYLRARREANILWKTLRVQSDLIDACDAIREGKGGDAIRTLKSAIKTMKDE